ncbi:hypothetical protein DFJ58DRAFT_733077 [Suillus subalutaceus]|uniref:uncharacterized protein n=1 Tax=Suillus subalutaceus TaxID=48586 RepID=UPI001B871453|nr:uncharacterized protein DFJ58DRAFT_733077 [Suillus subalutaceus]KAG1839979.1 hypothetical protein DFJ58DRAFT_733077 [Suillus subalutaceus]
MPPWPDDPESVTKPKHDPSQQVIAPPHVDNPESITKPESDPPLQVITPPHVDNPKSVTKPESDPPQQVITPPCPNDPDSITEPESDPPKPIAQSSAVIKPVKSIFAMPSPPPPGSIYWKYVSQEEDKVWYDQSYTDRNFLVVHAMKQELEEAFE